MPENLHTNIFVSSVLDSPIDTLYHAVQKVFAPVLLKDARWSKNIDPKIQHLLTELEAGLGSTLRRHGKVGVAQEKSGSSSTGLQLSGILTPSDEFQYWAEASMSSSKLTTRERAQFFQESFQPIVTEFANLDALSFTDVLELVEVTQDTLDDLWKQSDHSPPYPEDRMRHLLEIISSSFGRYVQRKLADLDVWRGQFTQVRSCLQDGLNICEKWSSAADLLTSQFWKQYTLHPWKGGTFVSASLLQLTLRLEEVMALRMLHEQLLHLLSPSEQQEFNLANAFAPFAGECFPKCTCVHVYLCMIDGPRLVCTPICSVSIHACNSCKTLIGVHGRMHPNKGLATVCFFLAYDPLSALAYPMITHTPLVASNFPIKNFGC